MKKKNILSLIIFCSFMPVQLLPMKKLFNNKFLQTGKFVLFKKSGGFFHRRQFKFLPKNNFVPVGKIMYSSFKKDDEQKKQSDLILEKKGEQKNSLGREIIIALSSSALAITWGGFTIFFPKAMIPMTGIYIYIRISSLLE